MLSVGVSNPDFKDLIKSQLISKLSSNRKLILAMLCMGYDNKTIGKEMLMTTKTIKWHLTVIYKTLEVRSDRECIAKYFKIVDRNISI